MKKFQANKNTLSVIISIIVALVALIILFSPGTPIYFLSKGIIFVFGFVGFWLVLPFIFALSIYILLKKKFPKIKLNNVFWGIFIIIIGLLIGFSIRRDLNVYNVADSFIPMWQEDISNIFPNFFLGGGIAGFFLAGCLNSLMTSVGSYILCSVVVFVGLIFIFYKQIRNLYRKIKQDTLEEKEIAKKEKELREETLQKIKEQEELARANEIHEEQPIQTPEVEEIKEEPAKVEEEITLQRAHFVMEENNQFIEPTTVEEVQEPSYEEPKVQEEIIEETMPIAQPVVQEETYLEKPVFEEKVVEAMPEIVQPQVSTPEPEEEVDPQHKPQPKADLIKNYIYPSLDLLKFHENIEDAEANSASVQERTDIINQTFANFRIGAQVVGHTIGPAVTRFDVQLNQDQTVAVVNRYIDDISIRLRGLPVRFEQIVFGKSTSGLEVPNEKRINVGLREAIEKLPNDAKHLRYIPFGKNISGELVSADLSEFPHMLVSGTTGSGKTIFVHSIILTLIMRNTPDQLRLILIDPKKVEMTFYKDIPHLLCPNISEPKQAFVALKKLVDEMERRYNLFAATNSCRDIAGFNEYAKNNNLQPLPYICVFVDEYADLVESCKEIREPVGRIAQKARAAGIHLVLATQRPSVNIIEGVIKSNISTRVALLSASATDSCTIIGEGGAEKLLGHGDMLISSPSLSTCGKPRVQGCFMEIDEITAVCNFLRDRYKVKYDPYFLNLEEKTQEKEDNDVEFEPIDKGLNEEILYERIKEQICTREYCSISFIQRTFGMGFPKAGRIFARLVKEGIVSNTTDARGSKVLVHAPSEQQMGTIEQSTFIPDDDINQ